MAFVGDIYLRRFTVDGVKLRIHLRSSLGESKKIAPNDDFFGMQFWLDDTLGATGKGFNNGLETL